MTTETEDPPLKQDSATPRQNRVQRLGEFMPKLTAPILGKKAGLFGKLVSNWADVAGADIATAALPVDMKFKKVKDKTTASQAVLTLGVASHAQALEISYQKPLLIERLNTFFGYKAIADIQITQALDITDNKAAAPVTMQPVSRQNLEKLEEMTASIAEKDLQTALKNLGKAILSRRSSTQNE